MLLTYQMRNKTEKAASANTAWLHRHKMADISSRLRRSKHWCDCGCPVHRDACLIRDAYNSILWLGADTGVSRSELAWYYENDGRVVKGSLDFLIWGARLPPFGPQADQAPSRVLTAYNPRTRGPPNGAGASRGRLWSRGSRFPMHLALLHF